MRIIIFMNPSKKRSHTEEPDLEKQLDRMFFLAAEEKLLPKIVYDYGVQNHSPALFNEYRNSVKQIYTRETNLPLRYNPEEARTHREKFREKVLKLIRNQLPIEYLKAERVNNRTIMTYQGRPLEEQKYPTREQFEIFKDFDENKFKKGCNSIFDDKLEYRHKKILTHTAHNLNKRPSKHFITEPQQLKFLNSVQTVQETPHKDEQYKVKPISLPKLISRTQLEKNRMVSPPLTTGRQKKPKKMNFCDEQALIIAKMKQIGGYNQQTPTNKLLITKESIIKYFKDIYTRPLRLIDFLEYLDVETLDSYSKVPQRLKLMPNEHIFFMTFLFYDSNNDGYICDNDLIRVQELTKKCPLLLGDYNILKSQSHKVEYSEDLPYKELYKLSEITEGTYFNWLKGKDKQGKKEEDEKEEKEKEIRGYFGYLNRKKTLIHYEGFKKIMKGQKPYLWYDLLWRISGLTFPDLKYTN